MEYEWYADLFFLEEAYRDVLILWLAAVLGRKKMSVFRLLAAGIAGGLCGTAVSCLELSGIAARITGRSLAAWIFWESGKVLINGFLIITAALPPKRVSGWKKAFFQRGKELGLLVLSAGILQSGLAVLRERCFLNGWKSLLFMGFFCAGVRFFAEALVKRPVIGKMRYQVRLFLNGRSKEVTGNRLVEPVTGKPVSIIAAADAKEFGSESAGVLMIPYRAVGTKSGMLPGILFDRMEIMDGENRSVRIDRPVVAVSKEPLFFRKDFTMILPESLFTDKL